MWYVEMGKHAHVTENGGFSLHFLISQLTPSFFCFSFFQKTSFYQVMPDDTCAGVCLRYKIKASTLRIINGFVGDNIQMLKVYMFWNWGIRYSLLALSYVGSSGVEYSMQTFLSIFIFLLEINHTRCFGSPRRICAAAKALLSCPKPVRATSSCRNCATRAAVVGPWATVG